MAKIYCKKCGELVLKGQKFLDEGHADWQDCAKALARNEFLPKRYDLRAEEMLAGADW